MPPEPSRLEMDLERRVIAEPEISENTPAATLAKAVMDEITQDQWGCLWTFFFDLKVYYTEHANLDELDTDFPPNASEGSMVGYYEILPFARPISFSAAGQDWAFDDQYCLRPACSCRAAALQCFRIAPAPEGAGPAGPNLCFRYYYDTRRIEMVETQGPGLRPETVLKVMRKARPDFDVFLAKRHRQLRHLYRLFLQRHPAAGRAQVGDSEWHEDSVDVPAPVPVRATRKPGRNDPCPCGSGKKYKKCCGVRPQ